ncbi:MAG TPA: BadF/BadG/BcrA/BcrD ATPase family protein [Chloroflexota bacterium]|jgi:N-acetylglucosamine kinase-like BadF-type ATPase|nr:BadF/BadG/BcrA/BcrD ATPase family protein [Chloroflexota bacterium]
MAVLYVGIDFGGSGTRAALATAEGEVLAAGQGGSAGLLGGGAAGRRQLTRSLDRALAAIGPLLARQRVVIHVGTTGLSVPGRRDSIALELNTRFPSAEIRVTNDALIALWGGLGGREGVAVLAGTGSIALARSADGREARAGGWGYLLGDEGSGFWLGRAALLELLREREGRAAPQALTRAVVDALGLAAASATVSQVIAWTTAESGDTVGRIASLAPLVSRAAAAGDPAAIQILAQAAQALAVMAAAAAYQLWPTAAPRPLGVVCRGGVWAAGALLADPFVAALREQGLTAALQRALLPPVGGALLLAMGAPNQLPEPDVLERLVEGFASTSS